MGYIRIRNWYFYMNESCTVFGKNNCVHLLKYLLYIYFHVTKVEQSQSKTNFFILWEKSGPFPCLLFIATSMFVLAINGSELAKIELLTVNQLAMTLWFYKTCLCPLCCYKKQPFIIVAKILECWQCFVGTKLEDRCTCNNLILPLLLTVKVDPTLWWYKHI